MLNTLIGFMGEVVFYYCSRAVFYFPRVLLRYLPFTNEILLDRHVQEVNFMNYLRENEQDSQISY